MVTGGQDLGGCWLGRHQYLVCQRCGDGGQGKEEGLRGRAAFAGRYSAAAVGSGARAPDVLLLLGVEIAGLALRGRGAASHRDLVFPVFGNSLRNGEVPSGHEAIVRMRLGRDRTGITWVGV